jgi:predicted ester cyclase
MPRSFASIIKAANAALIVNGDVDAIGKFFTPDYVAHVTGKDLGGPPPKGHTAIRQIVDLYHRAFTNLQLDVEILMTAKDRIAFQRTLRGRHTGNFKGFPATKRRLMWRDMVVTRFRGGLIAEEWVITDLAERLLLARKR